MCLIQYFLVRRGGQWEQLSAGIEGNLWKNRYIWGDLQLIYDHRPGQSLDFVHSPDFVLVLTLNYMYFRHIFVPGLILIKSPSWFCTVQVFFQSKCKMILLVYSWFCYVLIKSQFISCSVQFSPNLVLNYSWLTLNLNILLVLKTDFRLLVFILVQVSLKSWFKFYMVPLWT